MKRIVVLLLSLVLTALTLCCAQAELLLPGALRRVEAEAFAGDASVSGVIRLPNRVQSVGDSAFADTGVFGLWLPSATDAVGDTILRGANAAYVVVGNASASLGENAFADVAVLVGKSGSSAQRYAESAGMPFYPSDSLVWNGGFAYYLHDDTGLAQLAFPAQQRYDSVVIPESVNGWPVARVSPYAFTNTSISGGISLPQAAYDALPDVRLNWPSAAIGSYATSVEPVMPPQTQTGIVMQLSMNAAHLSMLPGETCTPYLVDLPEGEYAFSWYVTDESILTVDENGVMTAVAPGNVALTMVAVPTWNGEATASELGVTAYYGVMQIQVCEPSVSIDLPEETIAMKTGAMLYMHIPVQCPSSVSLPEMTFETDNEEVVSLLSVSSTQVRLTAVGAGQATVTVTATLPARGGYDAVSASASFTVNVDEPDVQLSHASLYTYCGYAHDLYVAAELPGDAAVSWSACNDLVTIDDSGRAVIGDVSGESVITCTVTYADGTSESADIPVYIRPWLSFGEARDRDDLNPGWEYGYFFDDLMPWLFADLWPHDTGRLVIDAQSSDEEVLSFEQVQDEDGNRLIAALAVWPGEATLTYSATLELDDEHAVAPAAALSDPFHITVVPPQITARLDSTYYYLNAEDRAVGFSYWWDGPYPIEYATFTSSDESVFTVTPAGRIIAVGEGWAQLFYTVHCYGFTSTAAATVEVGGFVTEMNPAEITLSVGETASVVPVLPVLADGRDSCFFSEDPEIASVTASGLVSGVHAGTTRIVYRTLNWGRSMLSECTVHVVDDTARLSLNVTGVDLYSGETLQLEAICDETPVSLVWTSTNDSAVAVDENGLIRVVGIDWAYPSCDAITCTATFEDGSTEQASCVVYGTVPVLSFVDYHPYYSMTAGETQKFHHSVAFMEGYSPDDFEIEYTSADERVAVVDPVTGMITAVGEGVTQVSVAYRLDGRIMGSKSTYVHVDTDLPSLDGVSIGLSPEHLFVCAPQDGETTWARLESWISDYTLWSYYAPYYTAQENDAFRVYDDGSVEIFGEGSADVYVQLHSTMVDTLYDEPRSAGRLTVGTPAYAFTVLDCNGNESGYAEEDGIKTVRLGDIVTVSVTGVPEDVDSQFVNWDYDNRVFQEIRRTDRTLTLRAMQPGWGSISMETCLFCDTRFDLNETLRVIGSVGEFAIGEPAVTLAAGETYALWPDFGWSEGAYSSSDESVVVPVEGEFPLVRAVAPGYAVLTARCKHMDQMVEATCFVTVLESEWTLHSIDAERVMSVGYLYDPMVNLEFTGALCPEMTFSFSDDTIMRMDEERWQLVPLRAGTVTVTVTATKDSRSETASTEITVVDPGLYLAGGDALTLRPGQSEVLTLVCSRDVDSVVWSSTHPHAVFVRTDDAAPLSTVVTASTDGYAVSAIVNAAITYADGSTGSISALVRIMPDDEIWLDLDADDLEISMGDEASIDYRLNCNVPIVGLTFTSSDEGVVVVSARGLLQPVAPGTARVAITANTYGASVYKEIQVTVHGYAASLSPASLTLDAGEARYIVPAVDLGGADDQLDSGSISFYSMNERVARVDELGMVTGVSAGETTIVYSACTFSGKRILLYCPVTVHAGETSALTLNASSIALYPRQSFTFTPAYQGELTGDIVWTVDDSDVYVGYDEFTLIADRLDVSGERSFGHVTCTAEIDGREETAVCQVEYLPATVSIFVSPSYCQLSVGTRTKLSFAINRIDPGAAIYPAYSSDDPSIASVDADGFITGVSEGVCTVRIDLNDAEGRSVCFDTVYVYVDAALPTPLDEGADFIFEYPHYYLNMDESLSPAMHLYFEDPFELTRYYPLHIVSEDEQVANVEGRNVFAVGEGTTTLRAWLEGFEECAVTAGVTVGNPSFSFSCPTDGYGRPVVRAGETLTLRLEGFPPFGDEDPGTQVEPCFIHPACDGSMLREISRSGEEITFLALRSGETRMNIDIDLGNGWWHNFDIDIVIEETGAEYRLNHTAVVLAQGEVLDFWPEFDWIAVEQIASSDETVVRPLTQAEGEDVHAVEAVAPGQATVTLTVLLPDEETRVSASCAVHVVEDVFTLIDMDSISSVMTVGEYHGEFCGEGVYVDFSGYFMPQLTYESSNPDVLAVEQTDEGWMYIPVSPGAAVLSVTAERNGVVQRMEKTILVVEPKVHFQHRYADVRPGQTKLLPLIIVNPTDEKIVENITYTSEDPGLVAVEDAFCGYPAMRITGADESGDTRIVATVDFMDGTSASAVCSVHIISNEEVWVNAWIMAPTLYTQSWGERQTEDVVWMLWDHNAAHWDEENPGTDTAMIEWFVNEEPLETMHNGVVEFVRLIGEDAEGEVPWNNGPIFRALSAGEVTLSAHLSLYDAGGALLAETDAQAPLTVIEPECVIEPYEESVTLRVAQSRQIGWNTYRQNTCKILQVNYLSSDDGVVYVDQYGQLFGVAPGQATVSCQYVFEDGSVRQGDMQVTVVGATVAWADDSMASLSLQPGGTATLIPNVSISDPSLCSATTSYWENANPYVVEIDQQTGVVTALHPGVATVSYWQNLDYPVGENGETEWGECFVYSTITVTDEDAVFSLNASSIALAGEGTFQLEPVYDADTLGQPLSIVWESMDPNLVEVDGSGLVSVHSSFRTFYAAVQCTAEFESGTQTAVCSVTVNRECVRPLDWMYGEGCWMYMDLYSELDFWDVYSLLDDSVHVELSFESSNPAIVTVSESGVITSYGVSGDADVVMTLRVFDESNTYTGESYVRSLRVRVNVDTMPESIEPVYETFVVFRQWNQHYLPLNIEPAYTGCYLVCRSSDESIVSFDEGDGTTEMFFHGGTGLVTIDVTAPDDERFNLQTQVLVVDEDAVYVSTEGGESALSAGQSTQLSLRCTDGIEIGPELIDSFRLMFESDLFTLTEDGLLTVHTEERLDDLELYVNVRLVTGYEQKYPLMLQINAD